MTRLVTHLMVAMVAACSAPTRSDAPPTSSSTESRVATAQASAAVVDGPLVVCPINIDGWASHELLFPSCPVREPFGDWGSLCTKERECPLPCAEDHVGLGEQALHPRVRITHSYDESGRLLRSVTKREGYEETAEQRTYDGQSLTSIGDHELRYDDKGLLVSEAFAGSVYRFERDGEGRLVRVVTNDEVVERYQYDVRGRLMSEWSVGSSTKRYVYDAGRLAAVGSESDLFRFEWKLSYDDRGRVTTVRNTTTTKHDGKVAAELSGLRTFTYEADRLRSVQIQDGDRRYLITYEYECSG